MPTLHITYRSSAGVTRALTLHDAIVRLGRDPSGQVLFDEATDRMVSRNHAEIRWENGAWLVCPLGGKLIYRHEKLIDRPTPLASGDMLEFAGAGGPTITVEFDSAPAQPEVVDDTARTVMEVRPIFAMEPKSTGKPGAMPPGMPFPAGDPIAADPSSFHRPPGDPPSRPPGAYDSQQGKGTAFVPVLDAAAFLSKDAAAAPAPVQERSRTAFRRAIVLGIFVLVVFASLAGGWVMHSQQRRRLAVQRIEALLAAQASNGVAPQVSEEDLLLFQEEVKANRHAAPKIQLRVIHRDHGDTSVVTAPLSEPDPNPPKAAASTPPSPPPVDEAGQKVAVRKAFAEYMRAQILRLSEGAPRSNSAREELKQLAATVKQAEGAYEKAAQALGSSKGDATSDLLRRTLRQLGECDALMPSRFLAEAKATVEKIKSDAGRKERLGAAMKRAADYRYGPTITAALADQGLPVELFFIPYEASGFDERRVELPTSNGIPKGMWGLLPDPAEAMGLHPGKQVASLDADPTDERQHYERESKKIAQAMRQVFLQKAGGSTLLFMATWDHGDTSLLQATKKRAGIKADDTDPFDVTFWKVYESGITDEMLHTALEYVATVAIAEQPPQFGFSFAPPLEHVSLADKE